ncbi:MAG TPA: MgtC/SapB family protein [Anaerovoracaceae bacterium]|nr:MgtC/SapB family protein [Anaerovoracaceae bacterium]
MTVPEMILRIALAMAIGGAIGWEREKSNRPAGLRTHMLVAVGAAVVMLLGEMSLDKYAGVTNLDPTRLGAQVISGIGFLGAGTILRDGISVRGLTTAASLWAVACLGLAAGGGFYEAAVIGLIAIILTLTIFEYLEKRFSKVKFRGIRLELECTEISLSLIRVKQIAPRYDMVLKDVDIADKGTQDDKAVYQVSLKFGFNKSRKKIDCDGFLAEISALNGVSGVKVEEY